MNFSMRPLFHEDDVIAEGRLHHFRHLAGLQGKGGVLKLLHKLSVLGKGQLATLTG